MRERLSSSVIIITFERPHLIGALLESLVDQTRPADEVVVVDNNSSQSYAQVLAPFLTRLPLKVVRESTPGIPAARNRGLLEAQGDIVLFTDDDCRVAPDWIEQLMAPFERDPNIGVVGGEVLSERQSGGMIETFSDEEALMSLGRQDGG